MRFINGDKYINMTDTEILSIESHLIRKISEAITLSHIDKEYYDRLPSPYDMKGGIKYYHLELSKESTGLEIDHVKTFFVECIYHPVIGNVYYWKENTTFLIEG